jgi:hypothetical protein
MLVGLVAAMGLLAVCPQSVKSTVAERTNVPPHVYEEAERQLSLFVSWARSEDSRPDATEHTELAP